MYTIEKYADSDGVVNRCGHTLSLEECEKKVLEIIIPDTLVSGQVLKTLRDIQSNATECEIIWYRIGR